VRLCLRGGRPRAGLARTPAGRDGGPSILGAFLRADRDSNPAAVHVLIRGGVGFHLPDGHDDLTDNVRIVTLPPYSPELNPVEGLWDQLKDGLCNRMFASLTEQRESIVSWLQTWRSHPRRVRSLIQDWLLVQANASSATIIAV